MPELKQIYRRLDLSSQPTGDDMLSAQTVQRWLQTQAARIDAHWLLVHSDLGVVWGKVDQGRLTLAYEALPPESGATLDPKPLQRCYLFGPASELLLWRDEAGWRTRIYHDCEPNQTPVNAETTSVWYYDEAQILSGTEQIGEEQGGFTLTADGAEGLYHAVPLTKIAFTDPQRRWRPLRLTIRHYLATDEENGALYVATGRLVCLWQTSSGADSANAKQAMEEATHDNATA